MPFTRKCIALYFIGFLVLLLLLDDGVPTAHRLWGLSGKRDDPGSLDFGRYLHIRTLTPKEFPLDDPNRRVIIIGDIHGNIKPLKKLLRKVAYDRQRDVLIHTGDILAKGSHKGTMRIMKYMAGHNIIGVRGNHDQKIIEWKGWIDWINQSHGGTVWLSRLYYKWLEAQEKGEELEDWINSRRKHSSDKDAKWWRSIPQDWIPFGDHYRVAKELTEQEYIYLKELPLKLHVPSAHTFLVHAGLLPSDVRYDFDDKKRQPLARNPTRNNASNMSKKTVETLRQQQEVDMLLKIPQNTDPWTNINIRSVLDNKELSRKSSEGTPWNYFWNKQMSMCKGFDVESLDDTDTEGKKKTLPCYPTSIIYGHAASRGLDIERWSFGLDTGCAYNRQLTAMILGPKPFMKQSDWEIEGDDDGGGDDEIEDSEEEDSNVDIYEYDIDDIQDTHSRFMDQSTTSIFMPEPEEAEEIILTENQDPSSAKKKKAKVVKFGEGGKAALVRVKC